MDKNKIPISLVLQWVYCPRRAWLEAAGERTDTYQMQVGYNAHRNVDDPMTKRANEIRALEVHGNANVSGCLIRELLWRDVPILWCTGLGRLTGWAVSSCGPNGKTRIDQHVASHEGRLDFAREFISSKIANQATQLRRSGVSKEVISKMREIQALAGAAKRWQDVLGYEGDAASIYFGNWPLLLKESQRCLWSWGGRSGRPAKDPLNAMLNYAYSLLLADSVRAVIACGLDPHAGFLHSSGRNKHALALDLMEEFRASIADSVVQTVVNNGEVRLSEFNDVLGSTRMNDSARKTLIAAYERRMATEIRHPIFGHSATWRRCIEIQARQVLGVLDGPQAIYRGIHVR